MKQITIKTNTGKKVNVQVESAYKLTQHHAKRLLRARLGENMWCVIEDETVGTKWLVEGSMTLISE